MILQIYGSGAWVDITPYIAFGGVKYTRNDVDGTNAGRDLTGTMIRDRLATKDKLEITLHPLPSAKVSLIMGLIQPETIQVRYTSPREGTTVTKTMYSNNVPATYCILREDGTELWNGITFPLVEI